MQYEPKRRSVSKHEIPQWYHDAKFGIFIHWSLSCVPAFAYRESGDINELLEQEGPKALFEYNPYAEWYLNAIRIKGSPANKYHIANYGEDYDYYDFATEFNRELVNWDPQEWADLFKEVGARYVVLVTKHHDGFLLWPSEHPNPIRSDCMASRNVVGELADAVRARGMRMGLYYSSPLDWTFTTEPIVDVFSMILNGPTDKEYVRYVNAHWRELIDHYEPAVLWNDIGYPPGANLNQLFAYYYNRFPEGVVDDRWMQMPRGARWLIKLAKPLINKAGTKILLGGHQNMTKWWHYDYLTPEYATFSEISEEKWECVRGMGKSFGYNREEIPEDFITVPELIHLLVDIVSKNGNLLLNVGPMLGGKIPDIQKDRLVGLKAWLDVNGEAIFATRPWIRAEGSTAAGTGIRFTSKDDSLYATLMGTPAGSEVEITYIKAHPDTTITLLGREGPLQWTQEGEDLKIVIGEPLPEKPAYVLKLTPAPSQA
jgi:alpha-L-fucosidase